MAKNIITINNLEEFTEQQVFDFVTKKVIEQGEPSINVKKDSCRYRHGKLKCAAGHLIPDDCYKSLWDVKNPSWEKLVSDGEVSDAHWLLIRDLQAAHDGAAWKDNNYEDSKKFLSCVKTRFTEVANKYNLVFNYEN